MLTRPERNYLGQMFTLDFEDESVEQFGAARLFDLEQTQIDDDSRLHLLVLGLAVTTLWMIHIGDWLTHHGHRRLLCPAHKTDYSLFRLGRDYVQRCRTMGWSVPVGFTVSHG